MAEVRLDILFNTVGTEEVGRATGQVTLLSTAVLGVGIASLKTASQFDTSFRKVGTIFGQAEASARGFDHMLRRMAVDRGQDVNELANALYQIGSAGVSASDAAGVLEASLNGAIGGFTDVETAADGVTSALNAWRLEADRASYVMDVFMMTQNKGKTTVGELAARIGLVAPTAAGMKVSLEETMAALATTTSAGMGTSEAITGLRQTLSNIAKPSKEAADEAARLGIKFDMAALQAQGLQAFLEGTAKAAGYSADNIMRLYGSVEAANFVMGMVGPNAPVAQAHLAAVRDSEGIAANAAREMGGSEQDWKQIKAAMDDLRITIGNQLIPTLRELSEEMQQGGKAASNWVEGEPELVSSLMKIAAATAAVTGGMSALRVMLAAVGLEGLAAVAWLPAIVAMAGTVGQVTADFLGQRGGRKAAEEGLTGGDAFRSQFGHIVGGFMGGGVMGAVTSGFAWNAGYSKQRTLEQANRMRYIRGMREKVGGFWEGVFGPRATQISDMAGPGGGYAYQPFSDLPVHTQNLWRGYGDFAAQHATAEWARTKEGDYKMTEGKYEVTIRIDQLLAKNPDLVNALAAQPAFKDAVVDVIVETERQPRQRY